MHDSLFQSFFLIFSGAAVIASLALYTRQPLLVAYIALGAALGPYGLQLVDDIALVTDIAHIGIIFLLFLLGLDMQPRSLLSTLSQTTSTGLISSAVFAVVGYVTGYLFGFTHMESLVIGMAMMFSSTIIGIKLLPTTVLHHKHTGELMVGLLLLQDFLAILCLMILYSGDVGQVDLTQLGATLLALPLLILFAYCFVRFVLLKLIHRFDRFHEYIFLVAIGWCLGCAELAHFLGLSAEIGAFIAGITLATSPISQYIAISLKPLRDFFLILFFFSLGARFNLGLLGDVWLASLVLAALILLVKPVTFRFLLHRQSENNGLAWDIGFRLGQISEFSLLIAFVAANAALIGERASVLIQATAIITFLISSYIVIFNYPNPIAVSDRLRRD
ncbi:cation:proton antiporter [Pseudomaricurvus sp. HS19]|uniref:cation:proton antiporter domain-containing protein n=1 Tax=Pseudomaricurvus sp. HS19 TaxID=2692626 RepID=UPI00136C9C99|nr:cation:proton antiporter [Pseudomaricurvus sp. HS19]MYM62234.1 cation:proton antiporter [Pseudomaricurvus sp. HS19]